LNSLLLAFLAGLIPAAIFAYPVYRAMLALKARQTVSQHVKEHAHKQGTPTMGGLMILAGLIPALAYFVLTPGFSGGSPRNLNGVLMLVVGYALIGFVDDFVIPRMMKGKRGLGWTQKLLLQIGLAGLAVSMLGPVSGVAVAFGIFSILFFSNAYNFADGLDWLAATVLMGLAGGIAVVAWMEQATMVTYLLVMLIGATLPFMAFNRPPAKIFMGDVGSMPIGALLGICVAALAWPGVAPTIGVTEEAIGFSTQLGSGPGPLDARSVFVWGGLIIMSFVMVAELVPVPLQIASVKLRKKRIFPMTPIHHAYQKAGWKETRIVAMFFGVQLVCSLIGIAIALAGRGSSLAAAVEKVQ
jgi:phospho-N-acetylmuramoyl-pentapeptide-transferase